MKSFKQYMTEEHGAGEEGTDDLLKKYADDTPGQSYSDIKKTKKKTGILRRIFPKKSSDEKSNKSQWDSRKSTKPVDWKEKEAKLNKDMGWNV